MALEKLPKTQEEYMNEYERICIIGDGQDMMFNEEIIQRSDKVMGRWPGFREYVTGFVALNMFGDYVFDEVMSVFQNVDKSKWEEEIPIVVSKHLGWAGVQIAYMLAWLEHHRQKKGWGWTLERIARMEGHYDGLAGYFGSLEKHPVDQFYELHPALLDFTHMFFYIHMTEHLQIEENRQAFIQALEGGYETERWERLNEVWLIPSEEYAQGGMRILVGFLDHFEYHKLLI
ncbi:hypothetical protein [Caldalkalibacillus thermarum]|uniref:hypothetical protein n=1 Tax=Caldalkalibacillus thermarum TaxID=296745 RepID=UPI001667A3E0|nr:hypothetical protein [Caldalkalibacillus thermarum]